MTGPHIPIRITITPHGFGLSDTVEYRGLCGYTSENKNEFRKDKQPLSVVKCGSCIERLGRVVVSEKWTEKTMEILEEQ